MSKQWTDVLEFHELVGAPRPVPLAISTGGLELERAASHFLMAAAKNLAAMSRDAMKVCALTKQQGHPDQRTFRFAIMAEELAEIGQALAKRDEANLGKELADLGYVNTGTAITFNIPLDACHDAVHASNMTKSGSAADKSGDRGKGAEYTAPNMRKAIRRGRAVIGTISDQVAGRIGQ